MPTLLSRNSALNDSPSPTRGRNIQGQSPRSGDRLSQAPPATRPQPCRAPHAERSVDVGYKLVVRGSSRADCSAQAVASTADALAAQNTEPSP